MKNKIKIMILTTTSRLCGTEKMVYELASRINKAQFEIMVCTIKDDLEDGLLERLRKTGIKTACLRIDRKWRFYQACRLYSLIKKFKPDILQSFLFFDNLLARFFGRLTGVSVIISGQRNVNDQIRFFRYLSDKFTLPLSTLVISNTYQGKEWLVKTYHLKAEKVKVVYNGIEIEEKGSSIQRNEFLKETGLSEEVKVLGFIGRLEKQKGIRYLIDAMEMINQKDPSIYAVIIGEGREKNVLEEYARSRHARLIFLGWKNQAFQYIKAFDFFVLPSLWEGMPNVVLEAMAMEVPVIATKVGGINEMIKDSQTGFLIEPGNSEKLAKKIMNILSLPENEKKTVTKKAKDVVIENFSMQRMIRDFENIYLSFFPAKPE